MLRGLQIIGNLFFVLGDQLIAEKQTNFGPKYRVTLHRCCRRSCEGCTHTRASIVLSYQLQPDTVHVLIHPTRLFPSADHHLALIGTRVFFAERIPELRGGTQLPVLFTPTQGDQPFAFPRITFFDL